MQAKWTSAASYWQLSRVMLHQEAKMISCSISFTVAFHVFNNYFIRNIYIHYDLQYSPTYILTHICTCTHTSIHPPLVINVCIVISRAMTPI